MRYLTMALLILTSVTSRGDPVAAGAAIAASPDRGNCLSCHFVPGGEMTGTVAPPLLEMKQRFPDKAALRAQIWDATTRNPESVMPPYGRHAILTEQEIDEVLEYVYSL